ncbi:MAG: flagellar biosynthesis anti-sigma factor FlgM [Desulfovibrionaceae bacterium]|nr:flagellar biosynthesis anti-sigma factor FlgM [Desulfovibrionaceae bacterium]MDD4951360.1 flagellar biosynthesis anti-sigma factor FlgM [Desulfovibrionaceae bacterium]
MEDKDEARRAPEAEPGEDQNDAGLRREKVRELKEQVKAGLYRPGVGEIAINLVRGVARLRH